MKDLGQEVLEELEKPEYHQPLVEPREQVVEILLEEIADEAPEKLSQILSVLEPEQIVQGLNLPPEEQAKVLEILKAQRQKNGQNGQNKQN